MLVDFAWVFVAMLATWLFRNHTDKYEEQECPTCGATEWRLKNNKSKTKRSTLKKR